MKEKTIGEWVKNARASRGWTQEQLSEKLEMTKANVSHWETGKHEPSFNQLMKVRDLTGYALTEVGPSAEWPFKTIPRERITSLDPAQLGALELGMNAVLASLAATGTQKQATG